MEKRAAIPVGLPVDNPTNPIWQDPPSTLSHTRSSELPQMSDVVVIGSGITGSNTALELLSNHPSLTVVMLECRTASSGATGRNGGHTKPASYRSFVANVDKLGKEEAKKIALFEHRTMKAVHSFARQYDIPCDSWEGETVDIMYDPKQMEASKEAIAVMNEAFGKEELVDQYRLWNAKETEERYDVPNSCGSVSYRAGSICAYRLVIGILELAIKRGLKLHMETPATSLIKDGNFWIVETPRGSIKSEKVILATNGYTARLYRSFQGVLVPLKGQVQSQRRPSKMRSADPPRTYSFIHRDGYEYMIQRPLGSQFAGDLVIGGGLTSGEERGLFEYGTVDDATIDTKIQHYLQSSTAQFFGHNWGDDDPAGRVRQFWSGVMGYTADGRPFAGPIPAESNLYVAAGFQGHGMVLSFLTAKAVASMMLGREQEEKIDEWFPVSFLITEERMKQKFQGRLIMGLDKREERHIG